MSSMPASPAQRAWFSAEPRRGLATRLVAGSLHVATGLMLAATVLGLSMADAIITRGIVVADSGDVATLHALEPLFALLAVVAAGHAFAGLGIVFGSRSAAALGIGLGAFDVIAGIVALIAAATGQRGQFDGIGIAMTFVLGGIVLAVAARAADWNTHGPVEPA
jgi:hypothetical protein